MSLYIVKADDDDRSLYPSNGAHVAPDSAEVIGDVKGCCEGAIDMRASKSLTLLEGGGVWVRILREVVGKVMEAGSYDKVTWCL